MSPRDPEVTNGWRRNLYTKVGEAVQRMRRAHDLSVPHLAARLGCAPSTLNRIEAGDLACPLHHLVAMAEVFDCTLDDLVPIVEVALREAPPSSKLWR